MAAVRVGLDGTPLLGARTGVGQYVASLVPALAALPAAPEMVLTPFTMRGVRELPRVAGAGVSGRRFPARLASRLWQRSDVPPVEWLSGPVDVFHGTNFVLPPRRRAAGVLTLHDLAYERFPELVSPASRRYRVLVPRALRRPDTVVITPSAATADDVVECYGFDRDRIVVTPLGVDPGWRSAVAAGPEQLRALGLPAEFLLFVGNREPRKNLPWLLAAYGLLRSARPDTPKLALVGPTGWGPLLDASMLPPGTLVTVGYVSQETMRAVVAAARCLVLPSRYEGFGLPLLEALACGTPVVASDLPVIREVTGGQATLVPVDDAPALAAALADALGAGGGQAVAARRRYTEAWTWERCARKTLTAYRLALELHGSADRVW